MSDRYWDGGVSADPTNVNNWSDTDGGGTPASSVPGTGDHAHFTANGDGNACTATAPWTLGELTVLVGYTSKIDLATFDLTIDDGSDITLGGGGEFDCGTGSHSVTNGTLDNKDQTTFTSGTSTFTLNGVCTIIGHSNNRYNDLTFAIGSTVAIDALTTNGLFVIGTCTMNGSLVLDKDLIAFTGCNFVVNEGANFSGPRFLYLFHSNNGSGITSIHSSVSMPNTRVYAGGDDKVIAPGTWVGVFLLIADSLGNTKLRLNGTYNFNGGLELRNIGTGLATLDNTANNPTINITGDLLIDIDSTGDVAINDTATAVDWTIVGNIDSSTEHSGAGAFIWAGGSGTVDVTGDIDFSNAGCDISLGSANWGITSGSIDLSGIGSWDGGTAVITIGGSGANSLDFDGETISSLVIDTSSNTLTMAAAVTMTSFDGISTGTGDFDPNGQTITITGDCDWADGFEFTDAATTMNGCTWVVGGDFTADGQTLSATASWILTVTGTAAAASVDTEYSDASGGTEITADSGSNDAGYNLNWSFVTSSNNARSWSVVGGEASKEVVPADNYREELVMQLHEMAVEGQDPVFLGFGEDAVIQDGLFLGGLGHTVRVLGAKARLSVNAISDANALGGLEMHTSLEYRHVLNFPDWWKAQS